MSIQGVRVLAGAAAAYGAAALLTAQQQQPVFRAGVELVQIDAVVTDRRDLPVSGLTEADFSIFENGRQQTIAFFRPVSISPATRTLDPKATPSAFVTNDAPLNRRLFVLVVDTLHIRPVDMTRARQLVSGLLQGLSPNDQVALVTTGPSEASVDLTADPVLQARAVAQLGLNVGTPWGFTARPGQDVNFDILENVTESLARSRHVRRVVVYISPATPFELTWLDTRGTLKMLRDGFSRTLESARRANVAVYAINPLGLDAFDVGGTAADMQESFARESGGRGFGRWSDYRSVVRQVLADNANFYVMTYYRDPSAPRDSEPSIDVRPTKPDLRVRARKGYVADPSADPAGIMLSTALAEPLPLDGLQLRASVIPGAPTTSGRVATDLTLEVIYPTEPGAARVTDELEFGVLAIDYDARVLATRGRTLPVNIASTGAETRYVIRDVVDLPHGPAVVRVGVSSKMLGRVATVHVPVRIPNQKD
jgi:VWFA-related protein